ncbi:MAG: chemotaxis protein CheX [Selenomonadales bacterium]|nr:chemotaxis protein CheX [Selenomonadales bacterium]MDY3739275.1 chemotaxis protein CheX [Selenomonadaceae bacterium]
MDAKLVNPFIDAFTSVLPMMGFPTPSRKGMGLKSIVVDSLGVTIMVGFTRQLRGNVVYNMSEETAKHIASTMMMGMPVAALDEMAQSAICEMSNMLTATAATNLTALGYDVDISTPSLTVGSDFKVKISTEKYLTVTMDLAGHDVEINIAVSAN